MGKGGSGSTQGTGGSGSEGFLIIQVGE
jgi:hypothetical protein